MSVPEVMALPMRGGTWTNGIDDVTLARALQSRDRWAPTETWARFTPMVRGIVARGLGRNAEVDDVTQEVFYRLFARIGTLRKPEALRQFVASFAIRVVKWQHRKRRAQKQVRLTLSGRIPECPAESSLPHDLSDARLICGRLLPRQRNVMFLRYVEGMTLPEIALALRLSLATIKRDLRSARLHVATSRPPRIAQT